MPAIVVYLFLCFLPGRLDFFFFVVFHFHQTTTTGTPRSRLLLFNLGQPGLATKGFYFLILIANKLGLMTVYVGTAGRAGSGIFSLGL
jgi:hypothetical protein